MLIDLASDQCLALDFVHSLILSIRVIGFYSPTRWIIFSARRQNALILLDH